MVKKRSRKRKQSNRIAAFLGGMFGSLSGPLLWFTLPILAGLACWAAGLDAALAPLVYDADNHTGWLLRQYGTWPGMALTIVSLVVILAGGLGLLNTYRFPTLHHAALITVLTTTLGAGLLAQVLVQEAVERPRPRESVLSETPGQTELRGQSFPSGHAAIGFVLAAPAFAFAVGSKRRNAFLALGLAWGLALGAGRMVLGAHFLGDVLAAMGFTLGTAALVAPLTARITRIPFWVTVLGVVVALLGIILGNKFTLDLTIPTGTHWSSLQLPCQNVLSTPSAHVPPAIGTPSASPAAPTLHVRLKGYGAPLSTLKLLVDNQGVVTLGNRQGLYHSLTCTATILLPAE